MEVILARHGEPRVAHSSEAPVDPVLTARGLWQARRLAEWLACEPIDVVITSSKRRAQQTAEPLQQQLGLVNLVIEDLDEIDRRARVYAPIHLLADRFPEHWDALQRRDWDALGWDPPDAFRERVIAAWRRLVAERPGQRVFVACHGGVIGSITAHVLGVESQWSFANPPFASFSRLRVNQAGEARVISLNEIGHFDATRARPVGPEGEGFEPVGVE